MKRLQTPATITAMAPPLAINPASAATAMQRWRADMADIMATRPDNEPVSQPPVTAFHME